MASSEEEERACKQSCRTSHLPSSRSHTSSQYAYGRPRNYINDALPNSKNAAQQRDTNHDQTNAYHKIACMRPHDHAPCPADVGSACAAGVRIASTT